MMQNQGRNFSDMELLKWIQDRDSTGRDSVNFNDFARSFFSSSSVSGLRDRVIKAADSEPGADLEWDRGAPQRKTGSRDTQYRALKKAFDNYDLNGDGEIRWSCIS